MLMDPSMAAKRRTAAWEGEAHDRLGKREAASPWAKHVSGRRTNLMLEERTVAGGGGESLRRLEGTLKFQPAMAALSTFHPFSLSHSAPLHATHTAAAAPETTNAVLHLRSNIQVEIRRRRGWLARRTARALVRASPSTNLPRRVAKEPRHIRWPLPGQYGGSQIQFNDALLLKNQITADTLPPAPDSLAGGGASLTHPLTVPERKFAAVPVILPSDETKKKRFAGQLALLVVVPSDGAGDTPPEICFCPRRPKLRHNCSMKACDIPRPDLRVFPRHHNPHGVPVVIFVMERSLELGSMPGSFWFSVGC